MEWIKAIALALFGKQPSSSTGFNRLVYRLEQRLDKTDARLDDCEQDREKLHNEVDSVHAKLALCDAERDEHRRRLDMLESRIQ